MANLMELVNEAAVIACKSFAEDELTESCSGMKAIEDSL